MKIFLTILFFSMSVYFYWQSRQAAKELRKIERTPYRESDDIERARRLKDEVRSQSKQCKVSAWISLIAALAILWSLSP